MKLHIDAQKDLGFLNTLGVEVLDVTDHVIEVLSSKNTKASEDALEYLVKGYQRVVIIDGKYMSTAGAYITSKARAKQYEQVANVPYTKLGVLVETVWGQQGWFDLVDYRNNFNEEVADVDISMIASEDVSETVKEQIVSVDTMESGYVTRRQDFDLKAYLYKRSDGYIVYAIIEITDTKTNEVTILGYEELLKSFRYYSDAVHGKTLEYFDWYYVRLAISEIY